MVGTSLKTLCRLGKYLTNWATFSVRRTVAQKQGKAKKCNEQGSNLEMGWVLKTPLSMSWPQEAEGADAAVRRDAVVAWGITRTKGIDLLHFYPSCIVLPTSRMVSFPMFRCEPGKWGPAKQAELGRLKNGLRIDRSQHILERHMLSYKNCHQSLQSSLISDDCRLWD